MKRQTYVQISAGGLNDSDVEAVNPFSQAPPLKPRHHDALTEEELTRVLRKQGKTSHAKMK